LRIELFIPTTYEVDIPCDNTLEVEAIAKKFSHRFGGCTLKREKGFYYSNDKGSLISEDIDVIYSFTTLPRKELELFLTFTAKSLCRAMRQECILFVIDNEAYFINKD